MCDLTGVKKDDVVAALMNLELISYYKGSHIIVVKERHYRALEEYNAKRNLIIDPACLKWQVKDWSRRRW